MTNAFFIADVHLGIDDHHKRATVDALLDRAITEKAQLYILGDFFDYWANNRTIIQANKAIFNKIARISRSGLKAGFIPGNRDFLLGGDVLARFGIDFLGEQAVISIEGKRILLTHGHTLCLGDTQFLRYKKRYWPLFRLLDRVLPGPLENYIAKKFMLKSKQVIQAQDPSRFQITSSVVEHLFRSGIDAIICGHVHTSRQQAFGNHHLYVLGSWENGKGTYLRHSAGKFITHDAWTGAPAGTSADQAASQPPEQIVP